MPKDFKIIVLISGRGSNLKSLIQQRESFNIAGVLSNKPEAPGLAFAREAGIPTYCFDRKNFASMPELKTELLKQAQALQPDLVVLAGFMLILEPDFIAAFPNKIINIHPSLLPDYPGVDTHARALAAGETTHGCSVHVVDEGVDTGPLIAQASCACGLGDSEQSLGERVLKLEHQLFPWVINSLARGDINLAPTRYSERAQAEARARNFTIFPA